MTTLIPYLRKSSKEDPAVSRDRQRRAIKEWAKRNNVPLGAEVWEPGVSGSKHWRERGLGEALAACERGEAAGIIVEEQSRLSRGNQLQTAEVWDAFQRGGFRLVCVADGLDTASGDQELNFGVRALLAREQWKQYARRMEHAKRATIARGCHISGTTPFGYRRVATGLVVDGPKAEIVRELYARRAAGDSYGMLTRWLEVEHPGGVDGRGSWIRQTVVGILRNRVYLGEARQGEHRKENAHEALVEAPVFAAVQARATRIEPQARPEPALLAGLVRCACCGYALSRSWSGGRWVYRHRVGSDCPQPSSIVLQNLDAHVVEAAFERADELVLEPAPNDDLREAVRLKLEAAKTKLQPFTDPEYVALIGAEAALVAATSVRAEIVALEAELLEASGDRPELCELSVREAWSSMPVEAQARVLLQVVQDVLVSRAPRGTALADRVEIVWLGGVVSVARPSRGRRLDGVVDAGAKAA